MRGRPFQKGNKFGKGNGYPKDLIKVRRMNRVEIAQLVTELMDKPLHELKALADDPNSSAMRTLVIKIIYEAIKDGDHARANFLFENAAGKLKDIVEIEGKITLHEQIVDLCEKVEKSKLEED